LERKAAGHHLAARHDRRGHAGDLARARADGADDRLAHLAATGWSISRKRGLGMTAVRDYLELSKARIVLMVLITTAAGYLFAAKHIDAAVLINALVGTALVAAGTNALNQYVERDHDAKMRRTARRPLPAGRIAPRDALIFASAIAVIGTVYLGL